MIQEQDLELRIQKGQFLSFIEIQHIVEELVTIQIDQAQSQMQQLNENVNDQKNIVMNPLKHISHAFLNTAGNCDQSLLEQTNCSLLKLIKCSEILTKNRNEVIEAMK